MPLHQAVVVGQHLHQRSLYLGTGHDIGRLVAERRVEEELGQALAEHGGVGGAALVELVDDAPGGARNGRRGQPVVGRRADLAHEGHSARDRHGRRHVVAIGEGEVRPVEAVPGQVLPGAGDDHHLGAAGVQALLDPFRQAQRAGHAGGVGRRRVAGLAGVGDCGPGDRQCADHRAQEAVHCDTRWL